MKGLKPIRTVQDLKNYLDTCNPESEVLLMPEEGDGFHIGGILDFSAQASKEVWLLIDEFGEGVEENSIDWAGGGGADDDEGSVWDASIPIPVCALEKSEDVIKVRGLLKSA